MASPMKEPSKFDLSLAIALHILETGHHVDFDNPGVLTKNWQICRDRMNAEQWLISRGLKSPNISFAFAYVLLLTEEGQQF